MSGKKKNNNMSDFLEKSFILGNNHFKIADITHGIKVSLGLESDKKLNQVVEYLDKIVEELKEKVQTTVNQIGTAFTECHDKDSQLVDEMRRENKRLEDKINLLEKKMEEISSRSILAKLPEKGKQAGKPVKVVKPSNLKALLLNIRIEKSENKGEDVKNKEDEEEVKDVNFHPERDGESPKVFILEATTNGLIFVRAEGSQEELKMIAGKEGILFNKGIVGLKGEAIATLACPIWKVPGCTIEKFISSKLKLIKAGDGRGTEDHDYLYRLTITDNQIQFRPKPNTESIRAKEIDFFVWDGEGYSYVTLWKKPLHKVRAKAPFMNNGESNASQGPHKKSEKRSGADLYPVGWKGQKYLNGYRGKNYNPSFAKYGKGSDE